MRNNYFTPVVQVLNYLLRQIAYDNLYTNIKLRKLWLFKLQENDNEAKTFKLAASLSKGKKNDKKVFQYQGLSYILEIFRSKLISYYYNDQLVRYFGIDKTWELITRKYYWLTLYRNVETYVKRWKICLSSKTVCYKLYGDL